MEQITLDQAIEVIAKSEDITAEVLPDNVKVLMKTEGGEGGEITDEKVLEKLQGMEKLDVKALPVHLQDRFNNLMKKSQENKETDPDFISKTEAQENTKNQIALHSALTTAQTENPHLVKILDSFPAPETLEEVTSLVEQAETLFKSVAGEHEAQLRKEMKLPSAPKVSTMADEHRDAMRAGRKGSVASFLSSVRGKS